MKATGYDTIKNIDKIMEHTAEIIQEDMKGHIVVFHGYFESIKLEQFYQINPDSEDRLNKLPLIAFEKLLR